MHEIAQTTDMDAQSSYDYVASFARSIGLPENLVTSALDAISAPAVRAHEEQTFNELVGDLSPQHRAALLESERRQAREEASKFERMMRENPSEYWKRENQTAYHDALQRSLVETPAAATPAAAPAPEPAAPAAPPATERPAV